MIYYTTYPDRSQDKNKPSSIYEFRSMMAYFYILIFVLFMTIAKNKFAIIITMMIVTINNYYINNIFITII